MDILPVKVKRRRAFIDELCLLKDISEDEIEYLRKMADQGEHPFWQALRAVCGRQSGEFILQIAKKSVSMVEQGYREIEEPTHEPAMDWGDIALVMIQWHMVGVCAQEMAKYENQELYGRVSGCAERTNEYLESVIQSRTSGSFQPDEALN